MVAAVLAATAFALVLFLNGFAILLSFVAAAIAAAYPYTKRFFALPQAVLGIAFGFGIPMAYAAIQDSLPLECWMLFAANLFYSFAYDTEYAMVDRDDDARHRNPHLGADARPLGRARRDGELCADARAADAGRIRFTGSAGPTTPAWPPPGR